MYVLGCRLSHFRLCGSDFGITAVDDITNGITVLLPHSTYFIHQFLGFVLFIGCCYGEIMCIWDSYIYQNGVLCFLIDECYIRSVKCIVLSVSMLWFQYSLKLSFSSTLAGVYF